MSDIKGMIIHKLLETERLHDVKIPLAVESGSRGWGFASPDSDYDCRFVYVHRKNWYLSVQKRPDIIEYSADPVFDVNGWDLKKVLQHIIKSNAVMFEWLSSDEIYIKDEYVSRLLQNLAADFFSPEAVSYHYLSTAKKKLDEILAEEEAKLKHYFYILRPIANLNYIFQHGRMPFMEYDRTLAQTETPEEILAEINELKALKAVSDESFRIGRSERLIAYFRREILMSSERLSRMKSVKNRDYEQADIVFREITEKVWEDECR